MISELWDKLDPGFFAPIWLLVGLVAVAAIVLLEIGAARRRHEAVKQFAASHLLAALTGSISSTKRILKRFLLISAVAFLFIAMARPHIFYEWREENRTGFDILMAVDCSKSMLTEDVKPNRLERAKLSISDFADHLSDNRLGLIAFAGDAFLQCPLTLDHDAFQTAVRELDTNTIPRPGTDIATAIDQAVDAFKSQPNNLKILILITDGEDLEQRGIDAAKLAAQSGLKIYTVGVGTPNGGLIPEGDDIGSGMYHRDASGQVVQSKLDDETLRQIASVTGGAYVELGQRGEGLQEIYDRYVAPLPRQHFEERREKIPFEQFEWPLSAAILLLMLEFLINERAKAAAAPVSSAPRPAPRRRARNVVGAASLIALSLALSGVSSHAANTDTAERDYQAGKYDDALDNYRKAVENQPDRNDLEYNRGDAAYRAGKYSEAEEAFRKTLDTPDLSLQESAYYNLGNAQFKHGEALQKVDPDKTMKLWEQALHSYDSSLKLRTTADAHHNYDLVKKKLEELKQQQQQQQQSGSGKPNSDKKDSNGKQSQQNDGQSQSGQGDKSQQNQPGQNNPQDGQGNKPEDQGQSPGQQGNKPDQGQGQDKNSGSDGQGKNDQQSSSNGNGQNPTRTYSGTRGQDKQDPGIKSRSEAEALLDSLKDDERHVTAQALNGNNAQPSPASGKDW